MKKIIIGAACGAILTSVVAWSFWPTDDYYEYDAVRATDCLPGELFDAEYSVCYFDFYCESDDECATIDERYGVMLSALADAYLAADIELKTDRHTHSDNGDETAFKTTDNTTKVVEQSTPEESHIGDLSKIEHQIEKNTHVVRKPTTVFDLLNTLLPTTHRERIVSIGSESDGVDGTLAYVEPVADDGSTWRMVYDPSDVHAPFSHDALTTIVHEYGHVLALHTNQVEHISADAEYIECNNDQRIIDEGCTRADSYLTAFIDQFWDEANREAAYDALLDGSEELFAEKLYRQKPKSFVTEYAATNAIEDMAESFALFVLQDRPVSNTIANQKVSFFYQYSELAALRNFMRGGLALNLHTR